MFCKELRLSVMVVVLSCLVAVAGGETLKGKVKASYEGEKKKLSSVTFTVDGGETYDLGAKGKAANLAKEADGETVEIKGSVSKKKDKEGNEVSTLNVGSYRVIFTGKVEAVKDGKKVTGVTLGGREVKLDGKAKSLLAKAEGKDAEVTGSKVKAKVGSGKEKEEKEFIVIKSFTVSGEKE